MIERRIPFPKSEAVFWASKKGLGLVWTKPQANSDQNYDKPTCDKSIPLLSGNIRLTLNVSKKGDTGISITTIDLYSPQKSISGIARKSSDGKNYIEMHFDPPSKLLSTMNSTRKTFMSFSFDEYSGFLNEWSKKYPDIELTIGLTNQRMAKFAVRHLGFSNEDYHKTRFPGVLISGERSELLQKLPQLKQSIDRIHQNQKG